MRLRASMCSMINRRTENIHNNQAFLGIFIPVFDIIAFFFTFALTFLTLKPNYVIVKQLLFGQEHVIFNYNMNIFSYQLPTMIFHCVDIMCSTPRH